MKRTLYKKIFSNIYQLLQTPLKEEYPGRTKLTEAERKLTGKKKFL